MTQQTSAGIISTLVEGMRSAVANPLELSPVTSPHNPRTLTVVDVNKAIDRTFRRGVSQNKIGRYLRTLPSPHTLLSSAAFIAMLIDGLDDLVCWISCLGRAHGVI